MPNYRYKCNCGYEETVMLPISSDPKLPEECPDCLGDMKRVITSSTFKMERDTLGKWFKKKTGKDLLGGAEC